MRSESDFQILSSDVHSSTIKEGCGCKSTVLLADDNSFNLIPLRYVLEQNFSIRCDLVENGFQEVEEFKNNMEKSCC
jgi:hypothetical protein